jgi:uncharacterized membrane protein
VHESEKLAGVLENLGYLLSDSIENADVIVFNTCAIRGGAEDRAFGNIGALKKFKKDNPNKIIAVCGCMTQNQSVAEHIYKTFPFVDIIFGTAATLAAGLLTYLFRNIRFKGMPILSALPPVIINAVVVGWELCIMINGSFHPVIFTAQAVSVGVGQIISCGIGLFLVRIIENNTRLKEIMMR